VNSFSVDATKSDDFLRIPERNPCVIDARSHLSAAVAELHERVDRAMSLENMTTIDDYRRHLRCHAQVVLPLERALESHRHVNDIPDIAHRWRSNALAEDLRTLGEPHSKYLDTPIGGSRAAIAGAMYVLEGSRLGAKVLLRQLGTRGGQDLPIEFFSHGATERLWSSFVSWLNSVDWSPAEISEMCETARAVFQTYLVSCEDGA
jgi:heme oxygenase